VNAEDEEQVGSDARRTVLYAQVRDGQPRMAIDEEGYLRAEGWPGSGGKVYLGDVAQAALRALGPHDPPRFVGQPSFDEQIWSLGSHANELHMTISSSPYWGFGLLTSCFLNRIEISGPLGLRARCVHDLAASLGRNPWEPSRLRQFEKATGCESARHRSAWEELITRASEDMSEEVDQLEDSLRRLRGLDEAASGVLDAAGMAIGEARAALADRNAPAVERALGRAASALIEADPETQVRSAESSAQRTAPKPGPAKRDDVEAGHLLEEIPFVDLSEEE
tara:strand:+ start:190 stop:1029 length:840 start_codon:yes stop_codon:yes gene_type:complete